MSERLVFDLRGFQLNIDQNVVARVQALVVDSCLSNKSLSGALQAIETLVTDGLVRKNDFDLLLKLLIPINNSNQTNTTSRIFLSNYLFDILDATNNGIVEVSDVMCGLSVLLSGSKSNKLAFLFDVCDEDADGYLSKRQLWKYFRCFLSCVLLICTDNYTIHHSNNADHEESRTLSTLTKNDIRTIADEVSVWTCSSILQYINRNHSATSLSFENAKTRVSFQDISDWYSAVGYANSSWIELLDLGKWLRTKNESDNCTSTTSNNDDQLKILYQCQLSTDKSLVLSEIDAAYVRSVSVSTGFYAVDCNLLVKALHYFTMHKKSNFTSETLPYINYPMFIDFIQGLLPPQTGSSDNGKLAAALSYVFSLFEHKIQPSQRGQDGHDQKVTYFPSVACGLILLCNGSKSNKLSLGFNLFDIDNDGYLSIYELSLFLYSYLITLLGFSNHALQNKYLENLMSIPYDETNKYKNWILEVCQDLSLLIITECCQNEQLDGNVNQGIQIRNNGILINFETFGNWYNNGGFKHMSWIELIDLYKWIEYLPTPDAKPNKNFMESRRKEETDDDSAYGHALDYVWLTQQYDHMLGQEPPISNTQLNSSVKLSNPSSPTIHLSPKHDCDDYDEAYSMRTDDQSISTNRTNNSTYDKEFDRLARTLYRGPSVDDSIYSESMAEPSQGCSDSCSDSVENLKHDESIDRTAFTLNLSSSKFDCVFPVSHMIVKNVCLFSTRLGLSSITPSTLAKVIVQYADPITHLLSKQNYNLAINELLGISKTSLYYGTKEEYMRTQMNTNNTNENQHRIVCNGYNVILDSLFFAYSRNYRGDGDASISIHKTKPKKSVKKQVKQAARSPSTSCSGDSMNMNDDEVDVVDIVCGLMLLCQGSKSDKLLLAYDIIANQYHSSIISEAVSTSNSNIVPGVFSSTVKIAQKSALNTLSRYETWRFFRNFLVGLFTLCGCYLQLDTNMGSESGTSVSSSDSATMNANTYEIQEKLLDNVTCYITDNIMNYLRYMHTTDNNSSMNHNRVSFDDIAEWYSGGTDGATSAFKNLPFKYGNEIINWLELLDMSKWVKLISHP